MTPREELTESLWMMAENCPTESEIERELKHYAIGRWVSVEERLPEDFCDLFVMDDGESCVAFFDPEDHGFYTGEYSSLHNVTHWLALDMPSWKGEA